MTQLVELQQSLPEFEAAGIRLYAVSYDSPEALREFARKQGITFPLLSDVDSTQIRRLGLLNTLVPPHEVPFHGIPWPGTFLLDADGVVTAKFFHSNPAHRVTAERVVGSALGHLLVSEAAPNATAGDDAIQVSAIWQGSGLHAATVRSLVVRFTLAEGMHIYGGPVPEGMIPTTVEISGPPGLRVEAPELPPTRDLHLPLLQATIPVWEGTVDMVFPVWADSRLLTGMGTSDLTSIQLTVTARYQGCDGQTCLLPRTQTLTVDVPVVSMVGNTLIPADRDAGMMTLRHLGRQVLRGLYRHPIRGSVYLLKLTVQLIRGPLWRKS